MTEQKSNKPKTPAAPENETTAPHGESVFDALHEGIETVVHGRRKMRLFGAKMVGYIAVIYGACTLSAYYFILGMIVVGFFWMADRGIAAQEKNGQREPDSPKDSPATQADRP